MLLEHHRESIPNSWHNSNMRDSINKEREVSLTNWYHERFENRLENLLLQLNKTKCEINSSLRKNECLLKHNDAKVSCDILFKGEPDSYAFQVKIKQCIEKKGFVYGTESCETIFRNALEAC